MKELLNKIESLKHELESLKPIDSKNKSILWEKFRLEWNYNSNHIEGNTMTYGDTKLLLRLGDEFKAQNNSLKDVNEMRAHDVAIHTIREWAKDDHQNLTEKDIRDLNQIILVKDFWADARTPEPHSQPTRRLIKVGQYKEYPNHVELKSGEIFKYAEPNEVAAKMQELLDWYRNQTDENALITAAFLHYKFVIIHPFDDGNGRVSRLLMNYHLMLNGYPPLIIKSADKANYLYALNQADTGNINAFFEYLGNQLVWSLDLSIKAAKGESVEEKDDLYKEIEVWKKQIKSEVPTSPRRNDQLSVELYEKSISNIFDVIEERASVFNELFLEHSYSRRFYVSSHSFREIVPTLGNKIKDQNMEGVERISISADFSIPVNKLDSKNLKVSLNTNFNLKEYGFYVSVNGRVLNKNYNYGYVLNQEEKDFIISETIDTLFKKIKTITA